MSLFFGDFPTEDTVPPSVEINSAMFFTCPACGACVYDMEYTETNRRLHEAWHEDIIAKAAKTAGRPTLKKPGY